MSNTQHRPGSRRYMACCVCGDEVEVGHDAARCVCAACVTQGKTFAQAKQNEFNLTKN